jgi:hypothetical protein
LGAGTSILRLSAFLAAMMLVTGCGSDASGPATGPQQHHACVAPAVGLPQPAERSSRLEITPGRLTFAGDPQPISSHPRLRATDATLERREQEQYEPIRVPVAGSILRPARNPASQPTVVGCAFPGDPVPVRRLPPPGPTTPPDARGGVGLRVADRPMRPAIRVPIRLAREPQLELGEPRGTSPEHERETELAVEAETGPDSEPVDGEASDSSTDIAPGALAAVEGKARQRLSTAFSLARRGAIYSARAELIGALRMIAQALDAQQRTNDHSRALAAGLQALREVDDFLPQRAQMAADVDLAHIVSGHRTLVLKDADLDRLTSLEAAQRYYTFAQQQFVAAGGGAPSTSLALFGLGKLQNGSPASGSDDETSSRAQAMVFYQAALMVDGRNFLAANELGVLLARFEHWEDARRVLQFGLSVDSQPALWRNLATVHRHLGEHELARLAQLEAGRAERRLGNGSPQGGLDDGNGFLRWVSPQVLSRSLGGDTAVTQPSTEPSMPNVPARQGISAWLPWSAEKR